MYICLDLNILVFQVPASCCKLDENGAKVDCSSENPVDEDKIFTKDCFGEAVVFVKGHAVIIGGVAVGIAAIMVRIKFQTNSKAFYRCL